MKSIMLVRHAQSKHNQMAASIQVKYPQIDIHTVQQYKHYKYSPNLMDASITELGINQCKQAKFKFGQEKIDVIFTSPLRRCLQTTINIFGDNPNIQIVVEPLLAERITSACDIGSQIQESLTRYKHRIDFSRICLEQLDEWQYRYNLPENKLQTVKEEREKTQSIHEAILNVLKSEEIQSEEECLKRVKILKKEMAQIIEKYQGKKIGFVSHGNILRMLTASSFSEGGKPIDPVLFQNCEIKTVEISLEE